MPENYNYIFVNKPKPIKITLTPEQNKKVTNALKPVEEDTDNTTEVYVTKHLTGHNDGVIYIPNEIMEHSDESIKAYILAHEDEIDWDGDYIDEEDLDYENMDVDY